jgi:hypothetical protein
MSADLHSRRAFLTGGGAVVAAASGGLAGGAQADPAPAPTPDLTFVGTGQIQCLPPIPVGETQYGSRVIIPIIGGRFTGRLNGNVVSGGADYNVTLPNGSTQFGARYVIHTDDGLIVTINDSGLAYPPAEGGRVILYPTFEAAAPHYRWLVENLFAVSLTAAADPQGILVHLDIYMLTASGHPRWPWADSRH